MTTAIILRGQGTEVSIQTVGNRRRDRLQLEPRKTHAGSEYSAVARASAEPWRLGAATAMALEDSLQHEGWPEGAICEPEDAMASKFGVGVRLMRQAFRILEARGACRLQRGRSGGLMVQRPDLESAATALADNLAWSETPPSEVQEALEVLGPMAAQAASAVDGAGFDGYLAQVEAGNPGLALVLASLERLSADPVGDISESLLVTLPVQANLASSVAWRIGQGITHDRCRAQERLGSLWDIAGQYDVSLAVATAAVRILEDADLVVCAKGRTGGVTLKLPDGVAVISVVHSYLAVAGMSEAQCTWVCHQLNCRAAAKAAETRSPRMLSTLETIYDRMCAAEGEQVMQAWYELQKLLHDAAGNRILHLLTRCLAAYCIRVGEIDVQPPSPQFLRRMVETTGRTVAAILTGDPAAAIAGQQATRAVLDDREPEPMRL